MIYLAIKQAHILLVISSGLLFALRGFWMLTQPEKLSQRWVKILPHLVDTCLFLCGCALMVYLQQYPFQNGWLTAKLAALLLYIVFGTIALKRGKTLTVRKLALLAASCCYVYMVSVAINRSALGFLL